MRSPEQSLRDLERSELFAPDFPKRVRLTHAQWAILNDEQRSAATSASLIAIRRARSRWGTLTDLIEELGTAKYVGAVPILAAIWADCALAPVRDAAGHALRAIGTPAARVALESLIEDSDHLSVTLAVQAIFDADHRLAFDRFAPYFEAERLARPGGSVIPNHVLGSLRRSNFHEPRALNWLKEDGRWMDLCVRLRRDERLGRMARDVLHNADAQEVKLVLSQVRAREQPGAIPRHSASSGDLVGRYRRGEHDAVWRELRAHDAVDGDFRAEALEVARETMFRVACAADLLAERLAARGWTALTGRLRTLPAAEDAGLMEGLERYTEAPLPPSLRAFWEIVGGIDFVWNYRTEMQAPGLGPDLAMVEMDPLCIYASEVAPYLLQEWKERRSPVDPDLDDPCSVELAPDHYHKANVSGGSPYSIELPFFGADPIFANEEHGLPFVDYLRLSFNCAGFPRLERHHHRKDVRNFVAWMTRDLEPF